MEGTTLRRLGGSLRCLFSAARRSWLALGWLWLAGGIAVGGEPASKEYQLKAAFLYNFTKFVEWPEQSFADGGSPIIIGILGHNPFGDELAKIVQGRKINGRGIVVKIIQTADGAKSAHLLFVSLGDEASFGGLKELLKNLPLLTVGESEAFGRQKGMINFIIQGDKLRFEINAGAAQAAGLKISVQLQKLAAGAQR